METPILTEPGIRQFCLNTLKKCNEKRMNYMNYIFNVILFMVLIGAISILLWYKYHHKLSSTDKKRKFEEDRNYILNRIKSLSLDKQKLQNGLITNLPIW
jgi:hypothetical protein